MKIIIDSENMKLNYEPLEKGQEYDVDAQIGKIWVESGRAHRTGSDSGKKSLSDEDDLKEEEMENKDKKTSGKTSPQNTADKQSKEKR